MVEMADIERIRWLRFVEGLSVRQIAKQLSLNRRTVTKWLNRSSMFHTFHHHRGGNSRPVQHVRRLA